MNFGVHLISFSLQNKFCSFFILESVSSKSFLYTDRPNYIYKKSPVLYNFGQLFSVLLLGNTTNEAKEPLC